MGRHFPRGAVGKLFSREGRRGKCILKEKRWGKISSGAGEGGDGRRVNHRGSGQGTPQVSADTRFREDMRRAMKESLDMGNADVIRRSIEEDAEVKAQYDIDTRCVSVRLREHGLVRVDTPAFGDCQFDAVVMTAGLPTTSGQFRQDVCDAMEVRGIYSGDFIQYMRGDGIYGNEITLKAIATLLCRPVVLVSNGSGAEAE